MSRIDRIRIYLGEVLESKKRIMIIGFFIIALIVTFFSVKHFSFKQRDPVVDLYGENIKLFPPPHECLFIGTEPLDIYYDNYYQSEAENCNSHVPPYSYKDEDEEIIENETEIKMESSESSDYEKERENLIENEGLSRKKRAIDGSPVVDEDEFNFLVKINASHKICGGSIINNRTILTAAHCIFESNVSSIKVEFRLNNSSTLNLKVVGYYIHKKFRNGTSKEGYYLPNDIALLYLEKSIHSIKIPYSSSSSGEITLKPKPICLPFEHYKFSLNVYNSPVLAGYGATDEESYQSSPFPNKIKSPLISNLCCKMAYSRSYPISDDLQLCAKNFNLEIAYYDGTPCRGDSGGALFQISESVFIPERPIPVKKYFFQLGILSYGPIDCLYLMPQIYTNVSSYLSWIVKHAK